MDRLRDSDREGYSKSTANQFAKLFHKYLYQTFFITFRLKIPIFRLYFPLDS